MNISFEGHVTETRYLETLADDFDKLRMAYLNEFPVFYNEIDDSIAKKTLNRYMEITCDSDARLRAKISDYWEGERSLMKEIRANKLAGNTAYFDYFQNVFLVYYTFIENQFPDVLAEYVIDQTSGYDLAEKLLREETRDLLTTTEYIRAIQFESVMTFAFMEDLYQREYKEYSSLIYGESYDLNRPSKLNYITLRYGADLNREVIDKMHESLNGNFLTNPN